jgi:hypothetical protein
MTSPEPEPQQHSVTITVPTAEATAVQFPGHVRNTDRALELLGGNESVLKSLRQPGAPLRCRPRKAVRLLLSCAAFLLFTTDFSVVTEEGTDVDGVCV